MLVFSYMSFTYIVFGQKTKYGTRLDVRHETDLKFRMARSKEIVLRLYKEMLTEAKKFESYNFRMYALRKIYDSFKGNKYLKDPVELEKAFEAARKNLEMIKKQVVIGNLYSTEKLIIENKDIRKQLQLKDKAFTEVTSSPGQIK